MITGTVIEGSKQATQLGWPTANLDIKSVDLEPGIYAAYTHLHDERLPSVVCYGVPGASGQPKFEVHIFDLVMNLYGREVSVEIASERLSPLESLSGEELVKKVASDVALARKELGV